MARFIRIRRSAAIIGAAMALLVLIAVFVFRAPPWILVPAVWLSATVDIKTRSWADRRLGPR